MPKIMRFLAAAAFITALIPLLSCQKQEKTEADLVLLNGKVITVDSDFSIKEAVAVKDRKILAAGPTSDIKKFISPETQVIDLDQNIVLPGLIDAHAHMNSLGEELTYFNIRDCQSYEEIVERVQKEVRNKKDGEWIIGGRWDHTQWDTKQFLVHDALSAASSHNPVYLARVDGNSALVNQKALEAAGINQDTPNPEGGVIIKKQNGEPTGVLLNRAMNLVKTHFPLETEEDWKQKKLLAVDDCVRKGLTGWHEAGVSEKEIRLYKELIDQNRLKMRVYAAITRQDHDRNPENGWHPEQKMTREEAVKGFTIWAAYAAFQENILGSIEKGKYADFTVIDRDILTVEPTEILNTQVLYTIVSGEIQFQAKSAIHTDID